MGHNRSCRMPRQCQQISGRNEKLKLIKQNCLTFLGGWLLNFGSKATGVKFDINWLRRILRIAEWSRKSTYEAKKALSNVQLNRSAWLCLRSFCQFSNSYICRYVLGCGASIHFPINSLRCILWLIYGTSKWQNSCPKCLLRQKSLAICYLCQWQRQPFQFQIKFVFK